MKLKRIFTFLTALATVPVIYYYSAEKPDAPESLLSKGDTYGNFVVHDVVKYDSIAKAFDAVAKEAKAPVEAKATATAEAVKYTELAQTKENGSAETVDCGDIVVKDIPLEEGKVYRFSVELVKGGASSSVQMYNGEVTIYQHESPKPGIITYDFVAKTKTLQISLSYGPSLWRNLTIDEIVDAKPEEIKVEDTTN